MRPQNKKFKLSLDLNVLNHLGINLYSNVPAVLSEIIANSYDADASEVRVNWNKEEETITVTDDGIGMTEKDVNEKYLTVGYRKRDDGAEVTQSGRKVMGRKGIGKLSVFSIAKEVEVYTVKEGIQSAFSMNVDEIKKSIEKEQIQYNPTEIEADFSLTCGTKIVLRQLKKNIIASQVKGLRQRVARRFSVIGTTRESNSKAKSFDILIDDIPITPSDRDYYGKIQLCFLYDSASLEPNVNSQSQACVKAELRANAIQKSRTSSFGSYHITGWLGTADKSSDLNIDGNINKIVLFVRGKVAQEDILSSYNIGSLYAKYVFGEIHADFLDEDGAEDIAISSRQGIIEDDERFTVLMKFVKKELDELKKQWEDLRSEKGAQEALEFPAIKEWFDSLKKGEQRKAKALFGKIGHISESEQDKKTLIKHAILAFESMRYQEQLDLIDQITDENMKMVIEIFKDYDSIEATLYHQIIRGRISIIQELSKKVEANEKEKLLQQYLFDHLWLLDPSWERATSVTPSMERRVSTLFEDINANLSEEERKGRVDLRYCKTNGAHVLIELKRAKVKTNTIALIGQMKKYKSCLAKLIQASEEDKQQNPHIECIFVVGENLTDWDGYSGREESVKLFDSVNMKLFQYSQLLENAFKAYKEYMEADKTVSSIQKLIKSLDQMDESGEV